MSVIIEIIKTQYQVWNEKCLFDRQDFSDSYFMKSRIHFCDEMYVYQVNIQFYPIFINKLIAALTHKTRTKRNQDLIRVNPTKNHGITDLYLAHRLPSNCDRGPADLLDGGEVAAGPRGVASPRPRR